MPDGTLSSLVHALQYLCTVFYAGQPFSSLPAFRRARRRRPRGGFSLFLFPPNARRRLARRRDRHFSTELSELLLTPQNKASLVQKHPRHQRIGQKTVAAAGAAGAAAILQHHYFRSVPHVQQQRYDAGRRWRRRATPLHRYDGQPLRRSPGSGRPPRSAVTGGYVPSASGFGSDSCSAPASGSPPPIRCRFGAPVYRAAAHAAASGPALLGGRVQL